MNQVPLLISFEKKKKKHIPVLFKCVCDVILVVTEYIIGTQNFPFYYYNNLTIICNSVLSLYISCVCIHVCDHIGVKYYYFYYFGLMRKNLGT